MSWNISISEQGWDDIRQACMGLTNKFLIEAINEAMSQRGKAGLTVEAAHLIAHDSLVDLAMQLIHETNTCNNGGFVYWIDPKGLYTIDIAK